MKPRPTSRRGDADVAYKETLILCADSRVLILFPVAMKSRGGRLGKDDESREAAMARDKQANRGWRRILAAWWVGASLSVCTGCESIENYLGSPESHPSPGLVCVEPASAARSEPASEEHAAPDKTSPLVEAVAASMTPRGEGTQDPGTPQGIQTVSLQVDALGTAGTGILAAVATSQAACAPDAESAALPIDLATALQLVNAANPTVALAREAHPRGLSPLAGTATRLAARSDVRAHLQSA